MLRLSLQSAKCRSFYFLATIPDYACPAGFIYAGYILFALHSVFSAVVPFCHITNSSRLQVTFEIKFYHPGINEEDHICVLILREEVSHQGCLDCLWLNKRWTMSTSLNQRWTCHLIASVETFCHAVDGCVQLKSLPCESEMKLDHTSLGHHPREAQQPKSG